MIKVDISIEVPDADIAKLGTDYLKELLKEKVNDTTRNGNSTDNN